MSNKYSEYFAVDSAYYPVVSAESLGEDGWKKTFPHKDVLDAIKRIEKMLGRYGNSTNANLWIEGAYGTGKSRVVLTLKKLLECSEADLNAYFDEYDNTKNEIELRNRLNAHKKGKIVTAFRDKSSAISNDKALIAAIYESLSKALKQKGCNNLGENTLRGSIVKWLSDDANKAYFETLIALPEYRGLGSFAGKTADTIIERLQSPTANCDALVHDILKLADDRNIKAMDVSMDELINWIRDVIKQNNLKSIFLFWDEFSEYFINNKTTLTGFQALTHLTMEVPFYLVIVTHIAGDVLLSENNKIMDRFGNKTLKIEMPDSVAFELIGHALKKVDAQKKNWEIVSDDLNSRMTASRAAVAKAVKVKESALTEMLPIHPMAALLLKYISNIFASNQRSMFNFIKNEDPDVHAFQWFCENYSPDDGDILTADFLWDFFYEKGTDRRTSVQGRQNLNNQLVRSILDTYPKNESRLMDDEKTVLKTVLMMQAMSQNLSDEFELFKTTEVNINLAFEGVDNLEDGRAGFLVKKLVRDSILYEKPMGVGKLPQYAAAAVAGDQAEIDNKAKNLEANTKTSRLVSSADMQNVLSLTPALKARYEITPVTNDNITRTVTELSGKPEDYKFRAVLSFAKDSDEALKIRQSITTALQKTKNIVFIDTSSVALGSERFSSWVDCAANEEYWRAKDAKLADDYKRKADDVLRNWKSDIVNGLFTVFTADKTFGEPLTGIKDVREFLQSCVTKRYPLSFDNATVSDNWFLTSGLKQGAKLGIAEQSGGVFQQSNVQNLLSNAYHNPDYQSKLPTLPISKLKVKINGQIQNELQKHGRISIGEVFDSLISNGFMPCNLYAYLTGFLLKDYATDKYRYSDGDVGGVMTVEKLGDNIGEYIGQINAPANRYKPKYIEVMTKEHRAFAELATAVFGTPENDSVEKIVPRIAVKFKEYGFPLWCFTEVDTCGNTAYIEQFASICNPQNVGGTEPIIATKIGEMAMKSTSVDEELKTLFTKENAVLGMCSFLKKWEDGILPALASEIGVVDWLSDVKKLFSDPTSLWLWDKDTAEDEFAKLVTEYKIISLSNKINTKTNSYTDCINAWREKLKSIHIPHKALAAELPVLSKMISLLFEISTAELPYEKRKVLLSELEQNSGAFIELTTNERKTFKTIYSVYFNGLSDKEIGAIYSYLPMNTFISENSRVESEISEMAEKARADQEKTKLLELWRGKTGTESPYEWSDRNRTPIIALIPFAKQQDAHSAFSAIANKNASKSEIKFALEFLENNSEIFEDLSDKAKIDAAFSRDILRKYAAVLTDLEEVRKKLISSSGVKCYSWSGNGTVHRFVENMAAKVYTDGANIKVLDKIDHMNADRAKEYLKELIKNNVNVGIEIMTED